MPPNEDAGTAAPRDVMASIIKLILFVLAASLSACGTVISPADLKRLSNEQVIDLPKGYTHVLPPAGLYDNRWKHELAAGRYIAELEGPDGTYFRGSPGCVGWSLASTGGQEVAAPKVVLLDGGIFMPRNAAEPAKIYVYLGTDRWATSAEPSALPAESAVSIAQSAAPKAGAAATGVGAGVGMAVVDAIIASERGKIGFQPPVAGLREAVAAR